MVLVLWISSWLFWGGLVWLLLGMWICRYWGILPTRCPPGFLVRGISFSSRLRNLVSTLRTCWGSSCFPCLLGRLLPLRTVVCRSWGLRGGVWFICLRGCRVGRWGCLRGHGLGFCPRFCPFSHLNRPFCHRRLILFWDAGGRGRA